METLIYYLIFLVFLLFTGLPIAFALAIVGLAVTVISGTGIAALNALPYLLFNKTASFVLVAIPLFLLMGEIVSRSNVIDDGYKALAIWVHRLPGGLLVTNIIACAAFAAISGSSVATAATIGRIAIPMEIKRNYRLSAICGSLAAGGTLGILIPPSINLIVYGAMTENSVGRLFMAGVIPGILLSSFFALVIIIHFFIDPTIAPQSKESYTWRDRLSSLKSLIPLGFLALSVFGTIYTGIATPTEAAAFGACMGLIIVIAFRRLTGALIKECLINTARTTSWIILVYLGAQILGYGLSDAGLVGEITAFFTGLNVTSNQFILLLMGVYVFLGCFIEGFSLMVITLPIVYPIILHLGLDPIWFGVMMILMCEAALITPPVGLNLYVIQGISNAPAREVFVGAIPFVFALGAEIVVLTYFPILATWLPSILSF